MSSVEEDKIVLIDIDHLLNDIILRHSAVNDEDQSFWKHLRSKPDIRQVIV